MISLLHGNICEKHPPILVLDVHGVGYEVHAPMTTFYQLPAVGQPAQLYTHLVIREDAHTLFGFIDRQTREIFRELIRVNGVGPKMALAILSALDLDELVRCISHNDLGSLVKVPGIGRKTAERLLVELRDRLSASPAASSPTTMQKPQAAAPSSRQDAESALAALGYKPADAAKAVDKALQDNPEAGSEDLIRLALRSMLSR